MQGRLSPPIGERIQAFPWDGWEAEFDSACACGFDLIEWLFEADRYNLNQIWHDQGIARIADLILRSGVGIKSICADYFMVHPFSASDPSARAQSVAVLRRIACQAARISVRTIVLPVLEESTIRTEQEKEWFVAALSSALELTEKLGIRVGIEADIPGQELSELLGRFRGPAPGVYYDVGNGTALGFDVAREIRMFGRRIVGVHIKDRKINGGTMPLGFGDVDFPSVFRALADVGFPGPYIIQGARGMDDIATACRYLEFVRTQLNLAGILR